MRVLHLPTIIASQMSVTVRALRDIGIDARGLVRGAAMGCNDAGLETYPQVSRRRHPVRGRWQTLRACPAVLRAIHWADVIHWHFSLAAIPWDLDLKFLAWLDKPRVVEFWGSDIRIPEIAAADNPYYAATVVNGTDLTAGSRQESLRAQSRFSAHGFECLLPGIELLAYVDPRFFPRPFWTSQRVILAEYEPRFPRAEEACPLVVHAPSKKAAKGTDAVLAAVEALKGEFRFRFQLIHNVPHLEARALIGQCDVMVDQLIGGDHGLAAVEAMAMGKPTVCYIKPSVLRQMPDGFPIVNANRDNLRDVLAGLLADGARRHQIGRESRAYVEKYHDAHQIARQLVGIYEELIRRKRPGA